MYIIEPDVMTLFIIFLIQQNENLSGTCGCNFQELCSNHVLIYFTFAQICVPPKLYVSLSEGSRLHAFLSSIPGLCH